MARRRLALILLRDGREDQGFSTALIQVASTIYAACRPVALLATLIRVAFSAGHNREAALGALSAFSALALEACRPAPALHPSCLIIPATVGDSFRLAVCASRQIPCGNRCSVHSARDRASHLDF